MYVLAPPQFLYSGQCVNIVSYFDQVHKAVVIRLQDKPGFSMSVQPARTNIHVTLKSPVETSILWNSLVVEASVHHNEDLGFVPYPSS